jgi:hypothetical protein
MQIMFVSDRKYTHGPPQPVTGLTLLFYMQMMFIAHRKHICIPPWPVTGIAFLYVDENLISQEIHP